jgi:hypothetical protein
MSTHDVEISIRVRVTIDDDKFTPEFMEEFCKLFYTFSNTDRHVEHLAQLYARNLADETSFIEGYGPAADMGIKFEHLRQYEEYLGTVPA